jgi:hypothetical protein
MMRFTNAFSKKIENHADAMALRFLDVEQLGAAYAWFRGGFG